MSATPRDPSCIFCRIVAGEIPGKVIWEDVHTFAFLDIHPLADGHVMVIPKGHWQHLEEMPDDAVAALFRGVAHVAAVVRVALGVDATTIGINNGRDAGQVVPHVHVHVVPRRDDDGGGSIHSIVHSASGRDLDDVAAALRAASEALRRARFDPRG
jgi:histidine triad (HIT) family protein